MARFLHEVQGEPRYTLEFSRSELVLIADVFTDMAAHLMYLDDGTTKCRPLDERAVESISYAVVDAGAYKKEDDWFDRWTTEPYE